jgi:type II secretory pathway component PulL
MHQIWSLLAQGFAWISADPRRVQALYALMRAGQQYYNRLSPAQKAQVDSIIRWGVVRAVKFTLGDVLGDVAHQVVEAGYGDKVADLAQAAVVRGVEVGIDKALEEVHDG